MIKIETIETGTLQEVATIHVRSWQVGYRGLVEDSYLDQLNVNDYLKRWQDWIKEIRPGFLARYEGKVAGFISFGPIRTRPTGDRGIVPLYAAEIYALYVHPDYWAKGIGKALMVAAVNQLKEDRMTSLLLWAIKKNERGMRFYEGLGGQRIGKVKKEIGGRMVEESAIGWRDTSEILKHTEAAFS